MEPGGGLKRKVEGLAVGSPGATSFQLSFPQLAQKVFDSIGIRTPTCRGSDTAAPAAPFTLCKAPFHLTLSPFPFTRSGFSSGFYAAFRAKLRRKSNVLSDSAFYFS